ncbi:MAG: DUF6600 domain-containing protein [Blastocatellia bacterium]
MRLRLPIYIAVGLLAFAAFTPFALRAQSTSAQQQEVQDNQDSQEDEAPPRVARLASLDGEVSFQRAGDSDWVAAVRNLPLLPGDQVYTGSSSHAQIQLDRDSFIWLSPGTALTISDFSNDAAQFEVTSGSVTFQISRLAAAFNRFEVDTQVAAIVVTEDGVYKLRVDQSGESQFAIKQGAADVTTSQGDLTLRDGREITVGPTGTDKLDVAELDPNESWDVIGGDDTTTTTGLASGSSYIQTGGSTDAYLTAAPEYVANYEDSNNGLYGIDDLSSYGTWTNVASYGDCWVPNVGAGWAPYRLGEWVWVPAAGWTWLSSEPWGWAPYHYGRWSFVSGLGWAWVPGFGSSYYNYGYSFYRWNPAPVYFFNWNTPQGRYVGWFPLPPGTAAHPHWHHRPAQLEPGRIASLMPTIGVAAARSGGISVMPASGLSGAVPSRPQPAGSLVNSMIIGSNQVHRTGETISDGLPAITPIGSSIAPIRTGGRALSAVRPPQSLVGVPVITRRIPPAPMIGSTNTGSVPRERKLVEPRAIGGTRYAPGVLEPRVTVIGGNPGSTRRDGRAGAGRRYTGEGSGAGTSSSAPARRWTQPGQPHGNLAPRTYIPERPAEHSAPSAPSTPHTTAPSGGGYHPSGGGYHPSGGGGASHSTGGGAHSAGGRGH